MDLKGLSISIPLIVLVVTLVFNLFKERRDRNYQYRPIATMYSVTNTIRDFHDENTFILYNDNVFSIDFEDEGVFLKITNITEPPILNVLIDVHYTNKSLDKYEIFLIKNYESFIIPISDVVVSNENTVIRNEFDKIIITYRSLSGQKYVAEVMRSGKINITAKRSLLGKEKILSTESNRNNEFRRL